MDLRPAQEAQPEPAYVVIGIDFGTTFSGVAWTSSWNPDNIEQIHRWEVDAGSARDQQADKVPSKIAYNIDGKVSKWGYMVSSKDKYSAQWFKLLLSTDATEKGGQWLRDTIPMLKMLKKTPVDVVADYLRCLWKHAIKMIELVLTKIAVDTMTFRVVLTMPANWDHKARELTREAAIQAGITKSRTEGPTTFRMVPEPEAAALAAFRDSGMRWRPDFKINDSFVVCDAGGGTVDLTSYTVTSLEPLELKMCVESEADLCGALYLDENFQTQIRTIVGIKEYEKLDEDIKARFFENEWEFAAKRKYNGGSNSQFSGNLPGYKAKRSGFFGKRPNSTRPESTIILEPGHMNAIFQPVVGKIVDLVSSQVDGIGAVMSRRPKAVLLVGGFGENEFVLEQLQRTFKDIPIQRPSKAWGVISRGAVFKGLSASTKTDTVTNYISKQSYGVTYQPVFNSAIHSEKDKVRCEFTGKYLANNQFRWYLKRGDNVDKLQPVEYNFYTNLLSPHQLECMETAIWISDLPKPPRRMTSQAKKLCWIRSTFHEDIFDELEEIKGTAENDQKPFTYRKLKYTLVMEVAAEGLDWTVYWKDQEKGKGRHSVEYE